MLYQIEAGSHDGTEGKTQDREGGVAEGDGGRRKTELGKEDSDCGDQGGNSEEAVRPEAAEEHAPGSQREQYASGEAEKVATDSKVGRLLVIIPNEQGGGGGRDQDADQEKSQEGPAIGAARRRFYGQNGLGG